MFYVCHQEERFSRGISRGTGTGCVRQHGPETDPEPRVACDHGARPHRVQLPAAGGRELLVVRRASPALWHPSNPTLQSHQHQETHTTTTKWQGSPDPDLGTVSFYTHIICSTTAGFSQSKTPYCLNAGCF